ncbi:unnamed protein product [Oppiella nova]|uniref:Uncharacterized protein n=1 Tax=Oppiella nova TaxID=334625 RepID=A0A7R9QBY1_9ACAR|nr:unnamed protein product [Oppiella nova]CAG2162207.1 unnamed protein product [Oppiella nova]
MQATDRNEFRLAFAAARQLDKKVLDQIASGHDSSNVTQSLIKKGNSLFYQLNLSDSITGVVLLALSLVVLCGCLVLMVKLLHSMLKGQIAIVIKKTMNRDYQFPYSILVNYLAILVGCILTILVQSSSIFTSALTPLAGIGVISLERMYPLTLGSNIGTTTTGILAALAADSSSLKSTLQLAFCHLFFNISGILIFYPIPWMRWPIGLARMLGNITAKYRWFSVFYLISMFFLLPLTVFSLSLTGTWALVGIGGPFLLVCFIVIVINLIQHKRRSLLPLKLQNWNFLPLWMHSLEPIDEIIAKLVERFACLACCAGDQSRHDAAAQSRELHRWLVSVENVTLRVRLNQELNDKEVTNL